MIIGFSFFLFLFKASFAWGSFRFTAKRRGRCRSFPCTPTKAQPPPRQHPPLHGTFVTTDGPGLTRGCPPESTVYTRAPSWGRSMGLDRCAMTCLHRTGSRAERSDGPKTLCALRLLPPPRNNRWSSYRLRHFAFSRRPCGWNHPVRSLFSSASSTQNYTFTTPPRLHGLRAHFSPALNHVPLSGCTTVDVSIHLRKDVCLLQVWQL